MTLSVFCLVYLFVIVQDGMLCAKCMTTVPCRQDRVVRLPGKDAAAAVAAAAAAAAVKVFS